MHAYTGRKKKWTQWVAEGGGEEDDDNDIKLGGGIQMFSVYPSSLALNVELKTVRNQGSMASEGFNTHGYLEDEGRNVDV